MKKYWHKIFGCAIVLIIVFIYMYNFYYTYEDLNLQSIMKTEESFKNLFDLRDDENIDINLTKADAVKIADIIMKDSTNRHYKVFYDDDNEIYYVVARYTKTRHNWLWVYKERTYITEHVVIDGKNGAVLNVSFKVN